MLGRNSLPDTADVLHIRVGHGSAGASVVVDGLHNVGAVGQQIVGNRAGEQRIVLKHRQAILDALPDLLDIVNITRNAYAFYYKPA